MSETSGTYIQIDLQNISMEAKNRGHKVDLEKIWNYFSSRESEFILESTVYLVRSDDYDNSKFESKLLSVGYKISPHVTEKVNKDGWFYYKPISCDVTIVMDCLSKIENFDKWIIFHCNAKPIAFKSLSFKVDRRSTPYILPSQPDYSGLCRYLKERGKKIELWSFKESYDPRLETCVDKIQFIDESFFYKQPFVNVFGFNWDDRLAINMDRT